MCGTSLADYSKDTKIIDTGVLFSGNSAWKNWVIIACRFHERDSKLYVPASHPHLVSVILLAMFGAWNIIRLVLKEDKYGDALASSLATSLDNFTNRILDICGDSKFASRALFVAAWRNRKEYVERFLRAGADVNYCENDHSEKTNYWGENRDIGEYPTPLKMAVRFASMEIIEKIVAAGADVNCDKGGGGISSSRNLLAVATERGEPAIINFTITSIVHIRSSVN